MVDGVGKYDDALTIARKLSGATSALLIVIDGENGAGFSFQGTPATSLKIPTLLRSIASKIEAG